jgi:hypothetical protein
LWKGCPKTVEGSAVVSIQLGISQGLSVMVAGLELSQVALEKVFANLEDGRGKCLAEPAAPPAEAGEVVLFVLSLAWRRRPD